MSQFAERKTELLSTKKIERELNLKQLQINSLLSITPAINDNVKAPELFAMYKSFLTWEMEVKKMALFILQDEMWICVTHQGISGNYIPKSAGDKLLQFEKLQSLKDEKVAFLHLAKIGVELTELRQDQAAYIGVTQAGPYKPEHYRY